MKIGSLLVILAIVLAVVGAGLVYSGYGESLQVQTVTSTQTHTGISTNTIASTSTETFIITSSSEQSILDQIVDIDGLGNSPWAALYRYVTAELDKGKANVSFSTDGGYVTFYMFTEDQFKQYEARHSIVSGVSYLANRRGSSYEFTVDIQVGGTYYFLFENRNKGPVSITLHVDAGMRTEVLTETREHVQYSTQTSPFVTETTSSSTRSMGLGLLFYSGVGSIIVAVIVITVSRMKGVPQEPKKPSPVAPVARVSPSRSGQAPGKFCINCGVPLPVHATFCNKCGSKQ
jgi:hypothetical protein